MSDKTATNLNLTPEGRHLLEQLAKKSGISMTAVIEVLLRDEARRKGIVYEEERE